MPYVRRNAAGSIVALLSEPDADAQEALAVTDTDVMTFLGGSTAFSAMDADFVRVTEDLIYVLMEKGVPQFTDLPADAQRKLRARESFRGRRLKDALDLLGDGKG